MKKGNFSKPDNQEFEDNYEEQIKWFNRISQKCPKNTGTITDQIIIELKEEAKKCYDSEVISYETRNSKTNSNYKWIKTVMSKGTVSDKIAAHVVAIQDDPVCNLEKIRYLVSMVKVGKKKECTLVIDTLSELFITDLLKPDEKLKTFDQQPLLSLNDLASGNAITRRKILSMWYFEDQLKELYALFISALNTAAHDTVDANKEKAISAMYNLLSGNPEQEKNLLSHIVNKFGDPSQKVASKAIYCLTQLLLQHNKMQGVVLNEIEKMIYRSNISSRAQYYSLCFLSQFYLSHENDDIARKLIEVYFSFFKGCIKKGEVDSRMMSVLLMGIKRAYPYAKLQYEKINEHIDTMYRLVHMANFNISLHALTLLFQVADFSSNINDRFYSALYKKLVDPNLLNTTHQAMLLSLIYKALLKDKDIDRVKTFIKRVLQISLYVSPSFSFGILYLINNLMSKKEQLGAFTLNQSKLLSFDDDGEEKYVDIKEEVIEEDEDNKDVLQENGSNEQTSSDAKQTPSWFHAINSNKNVTNNTDFNPLVRNPSYAGAKYAAYTELLLLQNHFHPTVSMFASNIMKGEFVNYGGDPLKDFTLVRFLDRFVFKNPKKDVEKQGAHPTFGQRKLYKPTGVRTLPISSISYITENEKNIPVDERFLYHYLKKKYELKKNAKDDDDNSDLESVESEEFEEMLDKMAGIKDFDEDIDYMEQVGDSLKAKKNKKASNDDSDDDIDNDDDENDDDGSELSDLGSESGEDMVSNESDDEDMDDDSFDEPSQIKGKFKNKKSNKSDISSLFASADEFATLLEDEGASSVTPGGSNNFACKDNAQQKQLAWEESRDKWLKGFNRAVGKGHKEKNFGKRKSFQKNNNKKKKLKK